MLYGVRTTSIFTALFICNSCVGDLGPVTKGIRSGDVQLPWIILTSCSSRLYLNSYLGFNRSIYREVDALLANIRRENPNVDELISQFVNVGLQSVLTISPGGWSRPTYSILDNSLIIHTNTGIYETDGLLNEEPFFEILELDPLHRYRTSAEITARATFIGLNERTAREIYFDAQLSINLSRLNQSEQWEGHCLNAKNVRKIEEGVAHKVVDDYVELLHKRYGIDVTLIK